MRLRLQLKTYAFEKFAKSVMSELIRLVDEYHDPNQSLDSLWMLYPQAGLWPDVLQLVYDDEALRLDFTANRKECSVPSTVDEEDPVANAWAKLVGEDPRKIRLGGYTPPKILMNYMIESIFWFSAKKMEHVPKSKKFFIEYAEYEGFQEHTGKIKQPDGKALKKMLMNIESCKLKELAQLCFEGESFREWFVKFVQNEKILPPFG